MYAGAKGIFFALSGSTALRLFASRYGMASSGGFARRFIAGESIDEAIDAARTLQAQGLRLTLDYLGESVATIDDARSATREYARLVGVIVNAGIERNLSLKLTQLGVDVDREACVANLRRILDAAQRHGFFVRIDMENSRHTQMTLDLFEALWEQQYRNVGVVLQAALFRTETDAARMIAIGAPVRLVKGAYKEPASVAYQRKADVDAAYLRVSRRLLDAGVYPAIATHDETIIEATCTHTAAAHLGPDRFEFQMLYGIRRDLQARLVAEGYRVRVYVPFGREWFPYFMRRLGERPANVGFVIRSLLRER